jgi:hypothetical protein
MKQLILLALLPLLGLAQNLPNATPMPSAAWQFVDANGAPLAGGLLYTCAAGLSCPGSPQATYTDSTASVQNPNPIVLDSAGRAQIWLGPQAYRLVLQDANAVQQWSQDNVSDTAAYFVNYVKTAGTATLITYTPPGAGAVQRTVASKLADTVSINDFGAACDWNGTSGTDNTTAIQTAITAVDAGGGGSLLVPAAACAFSGTLKVPNTVRLEGVNSGIQNGSQLVYTGNPSAPTPALVFAGPAPGNFPSGMGQITLSASQTSNVNSIGIWLGGDNANVQAPSTYYGSNLRFENNVIQFFGVGTQYGNNAFLNEWRGNIWRFNQIQMYMPTGLIDTGTTEKMYGGLFTGGILGGVKLFNAFYEFYGTDFGFNTNYQLAVDSGFVNCYSCNFEGNGESGGAGSGAGIPIATWNTNNPSVSLHGGYIAYDCSAMLQNEYVNFNGAATVHFTADGTSMGSFFGCSAPVLVSATGVTDTTDSNISVQRIAVFSGLDSVTQPLKTNITNTFYMNLQGASCYGCDGSGFSGTANDLLQGVQTNSYPYLFAPWGSNTAHYDTALAHWVNDGGVNSPGLMVYTGPPIATGPGQNLLPIYAGNFINTFNIPTATPSLGTAQQGELFQRSQTAFGLGRQRICAGDPSIAPNRTCVDYEANGSDPTHNKAVTYVYGLPVETLNQYGAFYNGLGTAQRTTTASTTYLSTDSTIFCDATGGQVSITLPTPAATNTGRIYFLKKMDATANHCQVNSLTSGNVDGTAFYNVDGQYTSRTFQTDGTNWWVIAH